VKFDDLHLKSRVRDRLGNVYEVTRYRTNTASDMIWLKSLDTTGGLTLTRKEFKEGTWEIIFLASVNSSIMEHNDTD